jgi:membrane protein DedA with SNARE-associated domain
MTSFLANLAPLVASYGYIVLFLLAIVEGPIVGILAGAIAASNEFNIWAVFIVLVVADLVGDALYYLLGRWSSYGFFQRVSKRLGITQARLEPIEKGFKERDWQLLLFGKTQAWGSLILYFAGTVRMDVWRYIWWNVVGTVPKVLLFEFAGYFFGQTIARSQHYLDYITLGTLVISIILLGAYWLFERYIGTHIKN